MSKSVRMTRRVAFSSGHRYWMIAKTEAENLQIFGKWASPFNHGHNYILDVTVEGNVDPRTGMVVNIKRIDDILKSKIVALFDNRSINDEIPAFFERPSSLENLVSYIAETLTCPEVLPGEVRLTGLRLEEMPTLSAELDLERNPPMLTLTRSFEFAASHRLDSPALTPEENLALFGKCNNPAGHGHNYVLEVSVSGVPDAISGMILNLTELDQVVNELVVDRYDHKNLNVDIPEFEGRVTTSEVVALEIYNRLNSALPGKLQRVRLHETARNIFEVST